MSPQQSDTPRFALGQRVRVASNHGGLYSAQIGVVGVIAKQRQKRRYGHRSYDMAYTNERGAERILIVREDDLEAVAEAVENGTPTQPSESTKPDESPLRFRLGQRVKVVTNHAGLYPTQVGVIGFIEGIGDQPGARWHFVGYAKKGAAKFVARFVHVREDDLEAVEPSASTPAAPDSLFQIGQRVVVHLPADGLEDEYPPFTHYPIVGEIASTPGHCRLVRAHDRPARGAARRRQFDAQFPA